MAIHTFPPVLGPRLAVLIDAENLSGAHAPQLTALVKQMGRPIIRRAYGDWTTSQLDLWKQHLHPLAIRPYQQFRYRRCKNASDSDFTGLAARIQERNVPVYGFGQRDTAQAFRSACDGFTYLEHGLGAGAQGLAGENAAIAQPRAPTP